jgi:hypothetical protein
MESTEGIFLMPRMQVTSNTQALVEMAYQIMREACDSTQQRSVNLTSGEVGCRNFIALVRKYCNRN